MYPTHAATASAVTSASICTTARQSGRLRSLRTSATTIGPLLMGMSRPVQIVPVDAGVNQLLDMACLAAHTAVPR